MTANSKSLCVAGLALALGSTAGCGVELPAVEYEWIFWLSVATPAVCVALALPWTAYLCLSRRPSVGRSPAVLLAAKLLAGTAVAGLRVALLTVTVVQLDHATGRLLASTALDLAAACLLLVLSSLEHFKSHRPSIIVCLYLSLSLVYDLARIPLVWTLARHDAGHYTAFAGLFTASIVAQFAFLVLESIQRNRWVKWEGAEHSPEETSSIMSLGLYSWLNPLLWQGYKEPLTMDHLYTLDKAISVENIPSLESSNTCSNPVSRGTSTWQIIGWLTKPLVSAVLLPVIPRLFLLGFTFCQPFFIQRLLTYLSSESGGSSTASGLIAVAVFTYSGIAFSTALYWYYQERFQSLLRGFLISSIYRKTAHIQHVGDGDSAAVTLMGADVERIYTGLRLIHEVWANVIQIALATWLLERQLGLAFLAPFVIIIFGFAASFVLSRRAVPYQSAWMARVQARIAATSAVLARIKDYRVSGMISPAESLLQREREDEIRVGARSRMLTATSASLSQVPQAIAPALAFAFGPHVLNETRAYTALSFLALLTAPLMIVLQSLPIIAACFACLRRIKEFLDREGREDLRQLMPASKLGEKVEKPHTGDHGFVVVHDASFGWTREKTVLNSINLSLPRSSITFVVGPVTSGKSTLCRALLGEVPHGKGTTSLGSSKLGYCDQSPFLFNDSVMNNIIGFSFFNATRYTEVIRATSLAEDLRALPAGDKTMIGTKGLSLSGGQRQRVSLARALYHDADILVLDDVFSGLDGSTQDQVCKHIFGPDGLLRKRGTTAIVCTHSTHLLSAADHIVALSSDGKIADQGAYIDIVSDAHRAQIFGLDPQMDSISKLNKFGISPGEISAQDETPDHPHADIPVTKPQSSPKATPAPMVDTSVYLHWLSTIGTLPLALYLALVVGVGFCSNFPTVWLRLWSADSVSTAPEHSFAFWIGIYAVIGFGAVLCVFPAGLIMLRTAVRLAGTDLHHAAVDTIMHSSLRFLSSTDVGKMLNLFSQDMNIMDTQLPRMVNNMSFCLATAIGQAVVIALSSAWLAISYPFFIAMLWAIQRVYLPSSKRLRILDLEAKTPLYTNFLDTLAGLPTIRAFGWFPYQLARNNALLDDAQRPSYLLAMAQQWLMLTMNALVALVAVVLVILATNLKSNAGSVGAGLVTLITMGTTLTTIIVAYTGLETSLGAISRLKTFGEETEQEDKEEVDMVPDKKWPMSGAVQIRGVEASYGDETDKVLKGLNLTIEGGEKVAICGRTGSGKSSILALLTRLIDPLLSQSSGPESSPIVLDGLPLSSVDRTALRERTISASQDSVFLPDGTSFRINLDPWNAASDDECNAALRELNVSEMVEAKGGLTAPLSGAELSAGQKQLFNLARAVLRKRVRRRETGHDGGLLLLDEITASVDAETERRVMGVLENEFSAYTIIMVTHKQQMALACDRVIMLSGGVVVEDGTPGQLLEKEGGRFRALWEIESS